MLNDQFISIAIKNLQDVLARKGISPEALFSKYDFDNNDSLDYGEFSSALEKMGEIKPAVDDFFDNVMVMVEDPALRDNRLCLLRDISGLFSDLADFSKIVLKKS